MQKVILFLSFIISMNIYAAGEGFTCRDSKLNELILTARTQEVYIDGEQFIGLKNVTLLNKADAKFFANSSSHNVDADDFDEYIFRTDGNGGFFVDPNECRNFLCQTWRAVRFIPFGSDAWVGEGVPWMSIKNTIELIGYEIHMNFDIFAAEKAQDFKMSFTVELDDYRKVPIARKLFCSFN